MKDEPESVPDLRRTLPATANEDLADPWKANGRSRRMSQPTTPEAVDEAAVALGEKLRTLRQDAALTLQSVAIAAGVSPSLLSQVERGLTSPSITTLRRVAAALNVPVAAFFVGDGASQTEARNSTVSASSFAATSERASVSYDPT
jgi:DNA-binding XRE family transcriptional regulator